MSTLSSIRRVLPLFTVLSLMTGCATALPAPREANRPDSPPVLQQVDDSQYLGGLRQVTVNAPPSEVLDALSQVETFHQLLPAIRSFRPLPASPSGRLTAEVDEGTSLAHAAYTAHVERQGSEVRFWVDRSLPHEINDAFGWFRVSPEVGHPDHTQVTFRVWIDIGSGFWDMVFGPKVESMALLIPNRLKQVVESSHQQAAASLALRAPPADTSRAAPH